MAGQAVDYVVVGGGTAGADGCSSHNTMIALRSPATDFADWVSRGAAGWDAPALLPYYDRLLWQSAPPA